MVQSGRCVALVVLALGCGQKHSGDGVDASTVGTPDACVGLSCFVVDCSVKNLPATSISGTVYAPNGTLPLYGVNVYVPQSDPGSLPTGSTCARCSDGLPGGALA